LTKGQQYVARAGYVGLSEDHITKQLRLLEDEAH